MLPAKVVNNTNTNQDDEEGGVCSSMLDENQLEANLIEKKKLHAEYANGEEEEPLNKGVRVPPTLPPNYDETTTAPVIVATTVNGVIERELKPDTLSGICCPTIIIYQHTGYRDWKKSWPALVLLGLGIIFSFYFYVWETLAINSFMDSHPDGKYDEEDAEEFVKEIQDENSYINHYLLAFHVLAVIFFFTYYKKRMGPRTTKGPSLLGKVCCPLVTTYYHENNMCNEKTLCSCFFGCLYTVFFYTPTYETEQETEAYLVRV